MALRILVVAPEGSEAQLMSETLGTAFPTAEVHRIGEGELAARQVPDADGAVIVERVGTHGAVEVLRSLRAGGFEGGAVLVGEAAGPELVARARALGAACLERRQLATALATTVLEQCRPDHDSVPARELRRMQRLVAIGELAAGFQHDVNNPLTALLAELQLLEAESLEESQRESVGRAIELCRRVVALVHRFDVLRPASGGDAPGGAAGGAGAEGTGTPPTV